MQDRFPAGRPELCADHHPRGRPRRARRHPRRPDRARCHGGQPRRRRVVPADIAGAFPEEFYSTTNQRTQVRLGALDRRRRSGDGLRDRRRSGRPTAAMRADDRRRAGMPIVVGHAGVRVVPTRAAPRDDACSASWARTSRARSPSRSASRPWPTRSGRPAPRGRRSCSSAARPSSTPAPPSTSPQLIREGWVQTLFAGNALATHDIEQALYGTSLGVSIDAGRGHRARPRAPPPRDQHDPPARRDQGRRSRPAS